jgi:hypothetical protein
MPRSRLACVACILVAAASCDEPPADGESGHAALVPCVAPRAVDTSDVSFRRDVAPVFERRCNRFSCHGGSYDHGVRLRGEPSEVRARIVGVPAAGADMPYVTPGDPEESFLLRKVEGDFCGITHRCRREACGAPMPKGKGVLPSAERDAIRRWIVAGARDD